MDQRLHVWFSCFFLNGVFNEHQNYSVKNKNKNMKNTYMKSKHLKNGVIWIYSNHEITVEPIASTRCSMIFHSSRIAGVLIYNQLGFSNLPPKMCQSKLGFTGEASVESLESPFGQPTGKQNRPSLVT